MNEIDPIEYGRLVQSVERLTRDVQEMQADLKIIKTLLEQSLRLMGNPGVGGYCCGY